MANGAPGPPAPAQGPTGGRPQQGGGLLPQDPRRRRITLAVIAAGVLAIVVLLRGRDPAAPEEGIPTTGTVAVGGAPPFGTTFADNGEAAGVLGSAITDQIGDVALGLESTGSRLAAIEEQLRERPQTQPSPAAQAGNPGQTQQAKEASSGWKVAQRGPRKGQKYVIADTPGKGRWHVYRSGQIVPVGGAPRPTRRQQQQSRRQARRRR